MAKNNQFTEADLLKLQQKGLIVNDPIIDQKLKKAFGMPKSVAKKKYSNKEKDHIELVLIALKIGYIKEYQFIKERKFRFDWAITYKKIAIEYNGIMSEKSRHTSIIGYSNDMSKINLATINGWRVLQYTPLNYMNFGNDIEKLLLL